MKFNVFWNYKKNKKGKIIISENELQKMLDAAYKTDGSPKEWYENSIVRETGMYNRQEI